MPTRTIALAATLFAMAVAACTAGGQPQAAPSASPTGRETPVLVAATPEAESQLLSAIVAELLFHAGMPSRIVDVASAADARRALELADVDISLGYTGEAWLEVMGRPDPPSDPRTSFARVREFDEANQIVWLRPVFDPAGGPSRPPADATFAFVVQGPPGVYANLRSMSDLARYLGGDLTATLCVDPEFLDRPDGFDAVVDAYDIRGGVRVFDVPPADAVLGVAAGDCVAGLTTATDGEAWRRGQRPLVDDLGVFPAFVVAPLVRGDARTARPGLAAALAPFGSGMTTARLGTWNARVAVGEPVDEVAAAAARELLLLAGRTPLDTSPSPVPAGA